MDISINNNSANFADFASGGEATWCCRLLPTSNLLSSFILSFILSFIHSSFDRVQHVCINSAVAVAQTNEFHVEDSCHKMSKASSAIHSVTCARSRTSVAGWQASTHRFNERRSSDNNNKLKEDDYRYTSYCCSLLFLLPAGRLLD